MMLFRGRPIGEMNRDELLEVIEYLAVQNAQYMAPQAIHERAVGKVEIFKRSLVRTA